MAQCLPYRGDLLYEEDQPNKKEVLHREEGLSRRRLESDDRRRVANELGKHSHPLEGHGEDNVLYTHSPDIVIVDGQPLLYHVTWPCGGDPSVLVASLKAILALLPGECVLVFDRYDHVSPKDHEWMRRGGVGSTTTTQLSTVLFQAETQF